jgi:uncharacterized integral membrane protein
MREWRRRAVARSKSRINLRDSQVQARVGLIFAATALVFVLLLAVIVLQNFNVVEKTIAYNPKTLRYPAILGTTALSGFFGVLGFGFGISSLGHKRNARQRESWVGFLLGAVSICLTLVLFVTFRIFALSVVA